MNSRKILKKLLAALEIEQAIPEVNQEQKAPDQAPINDQIQNPPEFDCIPFPEAVKKLFPNPWSGGGRCNELFILGPLNNWPCVCLREERPQPNINPDFSVWKINCVGNVEWKKFFNQQFQDGVKNRLCSYVKNQVKSGCLMPSKNWKEYFPIRISEPFNFGELYIIDPKGDEVPILEGIFDTQGGDNPCIVCIKNMLGILERLLRQLEVLLGLGDTDMKNFFKELWLLIGDCLMQAMDEGGPMA